MTRETKQQCTLRLIALICLVSPGMVSVSRAESDEKKEPAPVTVEAGKKVTAPAKREEGDYVVEKRNDGTTVKYKKKTSYDFEGSNIEGLYNKPSGSYISNIKDVKGRSIIRIRENFDAEVIDSSQLLK